jgi:prepilin-type processing-associated H-X9-DG protein
MIEGAGAFRRIPRMKYRSTGRCAWGFTLIELLVVFATIAVCAGLLFPSLARAKFQGRNVTCKNNLRQLGLGLALYADSFGAYPPFAQFEGGDWAAYYDWDQILERYLFPGREIMPLRHSSARDVFYSRSRADRSFLCPFLVPVWPRDKARNPVPEGARYGYNQFGIGGPMQADPYLGLCGTAGNPPAEPSTSQRENAVVAPSDMVVFGDPFSRALHPDRDGRHELFDWRPHANVTPPDSFWGFSEFNAAGSRNHRRKFNKVFCDGHVEMEDFTKPFVASDEYLKRWNNDNQPHRDAWQN